MEAWRGHSMKAVKLTLDYIGDTKVLEMPMGCLWRKASYRNQSKREKCVTINKAGRNGRLEEPFDIRHGDVEFGVCPDGF